MRMKTRRERGRERASSLEATSTFLRRRGPEGPYALSPLQDQTHSFPISLASPHLPDQNSSSLESVKKSLLTAGYKSPALGSIHTDKHLFRIHSEVAGGGGMVEYTLAGSDSLLSAH